MSNSKKLITVEISSIARNENQPRKQFDQRSLQELADSIQSVGLIEPVVVRPAEETQDTYQIVCGERRWRASKLAGLDTIDVIVKDMSDDEAFLLSLAENVQRDSLNAIDEALAYQDMVDRGYTQSAISDAVNKGRSYIAQKLRLLSLPDEVKEYVSRDTYSEGQARQILRLKGIFKIYSHKPKLWTEKANRMAFVSHALGWTVSEVKESVDATRKGFLQFAISRYAQMDPSEWLEKLSIRRADFAWRMFRWNLKDLDEIDSKYTRLELDWYYSLPEVRRRMKEDQEKYDEEE